MLLSDALELFYNSIYGVVSESTILYYKNRLPSLVRILGDKQIEEISLDDLRLWRMKLSSRQVKYQNHKYHPEVAGGLSPFTVRQYVKCARRFFNWLFQDGKLDHNPAQRLKLPPKPDLPRKGISKDDVIKLISVAKSVSVRDLAIVLFLADTGCRVGGLSHLKIEDIDLQHNQALVFEKGKGGSSKIRTVFFGDQTAYALSTLIIQRPDSEIHESSVDYLFLGSLKSGGYYHRLTEGGIYQVLKRLAHRCGIHSGFNPHNFRHGAIRGWLANGMPVSHASQLAGHSSISVTVDIYGKENIKELSRAHEIYTWLDEKVPTD